MPPAERSKSASADLSVNVRKRYSADREFVLQAQFEASPGFTILFGPSGAGKTTLLNCIAGLAAPDEGRIVIGKHVLFDSDVRVNIATAKRGIGYVLQDLALFPHLTVQENAGFGLASLPRSERHERAAKMLQEFHVDHLREQCPSEISGGERQRVALARALVTDPCLLLLDEPLAALDAATKSRIIDDLRRWNLVHNVPILYVTHSREEVMALGECVLVIHEGRIVTQGTPHEVLEAPFQETVAQLAGFENVFDAKVESVHEDRGTMSCRLLNGESSSGVVLETPLIRAVVDSRLRVGIRAGDILLATSEPVGLSARNLIRGHVVKLQRRDMVVCARVSCGVEVDAYLTLAARDALQLAEGQEVWLVIKTHSCHLMQK
jgi:molybdate transport system ATP-binding protein